MINLDLIRVYKYIWSNIYKRNGDEDYAQQYDATMYKIKAVRAKQELKRQAVMVFIRYPLDSLPNLLEQPLVMAVLFAGPRSSTP